MRSLTTPVQFSIPFDFSKMPMRFASIGSCFSEKIVELLHHAGIECASNPNGIVYNPSSIGKSVRHIVEDLPYEEGVDYIANAVQLAGVMTSSNVNDT